MHVLWKTETYGARALGQPHAAVEVKVTGDAELAMRAWAENSAAIVIAKHDVIWVELPERFHVLGPDGREVLREKHLRRLITIETFNPYHLIADVRADLWR